MANNPPGGFPMLSWFKPKPSSAARLLAKEGARQRKERVLRGQDEFIFQWFNERRPDEMRLCLDQFDAALSTPTGGEA